MKEKLLLNLKLCLGVGYSYRIFVLDIDTCRIRRYVKSLIQKIFVEFF